MGGGRELAYQPSLPANPARCVPAGRAMRQARARVDWLSQITCGIRDRTLNGIRYAPIVDADYRVDDKETSGVAVKPRSCS